MNIIINIERLDGGKKKYVYIGEKSNSLSLGKFTVQRLFGAFCGTGGSMCEMVIPRL